MSRRAGASRAEPGPIDWPRFVARHWERAPGKAALAAGSPLPLDEVFALAARAAAPFRDGMRFRAVPDVRLFRGGSQLHAPGGRLPAASDGTFDHYLARLRRQHSSWQLRIAHPLLIDFALWSRTRALLSGLLGEIGVPVLPIDCELVLGSWVYASSSDQARPHHAALTLVLRGRLTAQLRRRPKPGRPTKPEPPGWRRATGDGVPPLTLVGRPGELLCAPSSYQQEDAGRDCVALRAWIPVAGARVTDAVRDVAVALMDRRSAATAAAAASTVGAAHAAHLVPYLPLPASGRHDTRAEAPPLVAAARALREVTRAELGRAMQIQWAKRASALALEPVPAAAVESPLSDADLLQLTASPLIMPLGDGLAIWAVHGHAFSLRDVASARAVLRRLAAGQVRIAELPAAVRPAARELAGALLRLRAARVVAAADAPRQARR